MSHTRQSRGDGASNVRFCKQVIPLPAHDSSLYTHESTIELLARIEQSIFIITKARPISWSTFAA